MRSSPENIRDDSDHQEKNHLESPPDESSSLTRTEHGEGTTLHPEQALTEEKNRLGGVLTDIAERMKRVPKEVKLAMAVLIGTSALTFGQGSFQDAHAGQVKRGIAHEQVAPNAKQQFRKGAEEMWQRFMRETSKHPKERVTPETLQNLDRSFLNTIYNTHLLQEEFLRNNPQGTKAVEDFYLILESQISDWISQYIFAITGEFSPQAHAEWTTRLRERMPLIFDDNGDGKLDERETMKFREDLKGNFGLSALDHLTRGGVNRQREYAQPQSVEHPAEQRAQQRTIESPAQAPRGHEWQPYNQDAAQRFLQQSIATFRESPQTENPDAREIMAKKGLRTLISKYATQRTGSDTVDGADFRRAVKELNTALVWSFDRNRDGQLDRNEQQQYEKETSENLGFRMLKNLQ